MGQINICERQEISEQIQESPRSADLSASLALCIGYRKWHPLHLQTLNAIFKCLTLCRLI